MTLEEKEAKKAVMLDFFSYCLYCRKFTFVTVRSAQKASQQMPFKIKDTILIKQIYCSAF